MEFRVACVLAALGSAVLASNASADPGAPIQLSQPNACLADVALAGCAADPFGSFDGPLEVVVAPGGGHVYVANGNSGSIGRFSRDPTTNAVGPLGSTSLIAPSYNGDTVGISSDGAVLVTGGGSTSGDGIVELLARDASAGTLDSLGCIEETGTGTCTDVSGIGGVRDIALPPSGQGVYVAGTWGAGDGEDPEAQPDGAVTSFSVDRATGTFTQLGCIPATVDGVALGPCNSGAQRIVAAVAAVVVSPDGRHVYSGGFNGIAGWDRDAASGALLNQVACLYRVEAQASCSQEDRLGAVSELAMTPDGEWMVAAAAGTVTVLDRQPLSGALSVVSCFEHSDADGPCPVLPGFQGASGVAVSPNGATVYTAGATSTASELRALRLDRVTGLLSSFACVASLAEPPCASGVGLLEAQDVSVADDGRGLYTVAREGTGTGESGALAAFSIEQPSAGPDDPGPTLPGTGAGSGGDSSGVPPPSASTGPRDTTRPRITQVVVSPRKWKRGRTLPRASAMPTGTTIRWRMNEAARVTLTFQRSRPGRRLGRRCLKPTRRLRLRPPCARVRAVAALTVFSGHPGVNRLRFKGRLPGETLGLGTYRVALEARDMAGNASDTRNSKTFRIVTARRRAARR